MSSRYSLIICEKPNAARKIAQALSDGEISEKKFGKVSALEISRKGKRIILVSAVGHLYSLVEKDKGKWTYPVLETKWVPVWEGGKGAEFARPYLSVIENFSEGAGDIYNATDYDTEGAVIGYNILRFACSRTDAKRMHFSTLTTGELVSSFENASEHLDFPQIEAGLARHELDWLYGINLSRALTLAIKKAGRWHILSTGRVQGPALAFLAKREREIQEFHPVPFWQIELLSEKDGIRVKALHEIDKFWDKARAEGIFGRISGEKLAVVSSIEKREYRELPPTPFDLTKLQTEGYRHFGFSPKRTQSIAQSLYEKALISYPRTSSQKLPADKLDLRGILLALAKQKKYSEHAGSLAERPSLIPANGEKDDPAHPAIHPTGEKPVSLTEEQGKLYDLIVRRFLAVFGESCLREAVSVGLAVRGEIFKASGRTTVKPGWAEFYGPYAKLEESTLPNLGKGDLLKILSIDLLSKETEPPPRYNEASLIKALEKENLGTKATRAEIVETLYSRGYIREKKIVVTELGLSVVNALEGNAPKIISPELTREFECDMEGITEGREKGEAVLSKAKRVLVETLSKFKEKELEVGETLLSGLKIALNIKETLGKCNKCGAGNLKIIFNPKTRKKFVGCTAYPNCSQSFPLPGGLVEGTDKVCEKCGTPIIKVIRAGKRPFTMCIEPSCETKKDWGKPKGEPKGEPERKLEVGGANETPSPIEGKPRRTRAKKEKPRSPPSSDS